MLRLTRCAGIVVAALAIGPLARQSIAQSRSSAAPVVRGRITDSTGAPVAFARVTAEGLGERVADDSGRFLLPLDRAGARRLELRRVGFNPLFTRVNINGDSALHLVMTPLPASLAKVKIEAEAAVVSLELAGFYQRLRDKERGANTGHFITPEEIERRRGSVTQVVTGLPGLHVERFRPNESGTSSEYIALFGNSRRPTARCAMAVYVDRIRLQPPPEVRLDRRDPWPPDINGAITLREIAGIEVYTRSNAPSEFALLNGTCGVVLIWTK